MSDELGNLAQSAANALVAAMATDYWEAVKQRFVAVFGREHQVNATHAELARSRGADLATAQAAQAAAWASRFGFSSMTIPGPLRPFASFSPSSA